MLDLELVASHLIKGNGLAVHNPATGDLIATVRDCAPAEAKAAIEAAGEAFHAWANRTAKDRSKILRQWHDLIIANTDALAAIVTAECGKPLGEARGEVAYASVIEWFAEEGKRLYGDIIPTHAAG